MSILANVILSFCSLTAFSNRGPSCLHGSHHGAQKSTIIGFSLTGASVPAGEGILTTVEFSDFDTEICFDTAIISDPFGGALDFDLGPCEDGSGGDDGGQLGDNNFTIQNIDVDAIDARNSVIETKLDEAIDYTRDIKSGLRDDILRIEKQTDRVEAKVRDSEDRMRTTLQNAEERFENKRDALQNDYDNGANRLRESNKTDMKDLREKMEQDMDDLEERLNEKLQRALDNPLAD